MASTDSRPLPLKNTAYRAYLVILDADGDLVTGATGLDSEVSLDGAAFADCTNEATEIGSTGFYYLDLVQAELNADAVCVQVKTTSVGAKTTPIILYPQEADDIRVAVTHWVATALAAPHTAGYPAVTIKDGTGTGEIDTTSGGVLVAALAANTITATSIATDAITAAKVADGTIDAATFAAGAINAAAIATDAITAAKIAADAIGASELAADAVTEIQAGLATAAALATVQADTDNIQTRLPAALVSGRMDSDVGALQASVITAASIATDAITAAKIATDAIGAAELAADAVTEIQSGLATAAALATVQADTDNLQTRLPAALVGGRMDSDVGALQAGVITAGVIAADAIGAAELAADAVTEIQAGLATAAALVTAQADLDDLQTRLPAALVGGRMDASVGAMAANTLTAAALATDAIDADALAADAALEIIDGLLTRDFSAVTGEASRSLLNALRFIRNKWSIAGTTLTVTKEDDTTAAWTAAVTGTAGADPITAVDPA